MDIFSRGPYPINRFPTYLPNIEALDGLQEEINGVPLFFYEKEQMLLLNIPTSPSYAAAKDSDEGFLLYPKDDQILDEATAKEAFGEIEDNGKTFLCYLREQKPQINIPTSTEPSSISFIEMETNGRSLLVYTKDQTRTSSYEVTAMDSVGGFLEVGIDGKPYLVYHGPKYQVPSSSNEVLALDSSDALPPRHLFLCPAARVHSIIKDVLAGVVSTFTPSTYFHPTTLQQGDHLVPFYFHPTTPLQQEDHLVSFNHHPFPLSWCNNKIADKCSACKVRELGLDYYLCDNCEKKHHKGCVESPLQLNHPSHPEHALQLNFLQKEVAKKAGRFPCICCGEHVRGLIYACNPCNIVMHVTCAQRKVPIYIDQPKRHHQTLILFLRQSFLLCNICGLINPFQLTYACPRYNFVAHGDCIYVPQIIRTSRHHHRLSFTSSLQLREWICGVCRRGIDSRYGAFTCSTCTGYAVHTRCALRRDICDGRDLEEVPEEEEDIYYDGEPYQKIAEGIIRHFSHQHHRLCRLGVGSIFDEKRICQACVLPIYEGWIYSCETCDYILHETCAEARPKMLHPLHSHPLLLYPTVDDEMFGCSACYRSCSGFGYICCVPDCDFSLDIRCALISEPFQYQGHKHPLFLSLDPKEEPSCQVCKSTCWKRVLNCIECDFIICFTCATLPYLARYKHDDHYLKFCTGEEARDSDWCEVCEKKLKMGGEEGFYTCKEYCCTTLHINCLFGKDHYLKVGRSFSGLDMTFQIHPNYSSTRPFCTHCRLRCANPLVLVSGNDRLCSRECVINFVKKLRNMKSSDEIYFTHSH